MKDLFLGSGFERNKAGQATILLTAPVGGALIAFMVVVAIVFIPLAILADGPFWPPSNFTLVLGGGVSLVFILMLWVGIRSRVQVIVDNQKRSLSVQSRDGRTEIEMNKIAIASVDSHKDLRGRINYRLGFALRSGERVLATRAHFFYTERDCARVVDAINRELAARGETVR